MNSIFSVFRVFSNLRECLKKKKIEHSSFIHIEKFLSFLPHFCVYSFLVLIKLWKQVAQRAQVWLISATLLPKSMVHDELFYDSPCLYVWHLTSLVCVRLISVLERQSGKEGETRKLPPGIGPLPKLLQQPDLDQVEAKSLKLHMDCSGARSSSTFVSASGRSCRRKYNWEFQVVSTHCTTIPAAGLHGISSVLNNKVHGAGAAA